MILFGFLIHAIGAGVFSLRSQASESSSESSLSSSSELSSDASSVSSAISQDQNEKALGSVSFSLTPDFTNHDLNSVHVGPREKVALCVRLNASDPRLKRAFLSLKKIDLALESSGDLPQTLKGSIVSKRGILVPDEQGCFRGTIKITDQILPGKYALTELDLGLLSNKSLSLREGLREMVLGVLEIENPDKTLKVPTVKAIQSKTSTRRMVGQWGRRLAVKPRFKVLFSNLNKPLEYNKLQIFFKVYIDEILVDEIESKCWFSSFYSAHCSLLYARSDSSFKGRRLQFVLSSVALSDRFGHEQEWTGAEELSSLSENGKVLSYHYYPSSKVLHTDPKRTEGELIEWPEVVPLPVPPTQEHTPAFPGSEETGSDLTPESTPESRP